METAGYAALQIIPSMSGISASMEKQLQGVMPGAGAKAGASFGGGFGKAVAGATKVAADATAVALTAATAAGVASIAKGWNRLTTIQDSSAALEISLGSSAKAGDLLAGVLDTVKGTPFNLDQFAQAGQQMVGMGIEAEKVPGYLTAIGEASATQGGRASEFAGRLSTVFGQMAASGQVTLADVWRISDTGVNALAILANSFGVTRDEMKDMISKGAVPAGEALDALAKGITDGSDGPAGATIALAGTMEKLRLNMSGAVAGISPAMARLGAAILKPFSPAIVAGANGLVDTIDKLGERAGVFAEKIANSPAIDGLVDFFEDMPGLVDGGVDSLDKIAPVAGAALAGLAAFGSGGIPVIGGFLPAINPVAAAIVGLIASTPSARAALGDLVADVVPLAMELGEKLIPIVEDLSDIAGDILPPALALAGAGLEVVLGGAGLLADVLGPLTGVLADHTEIVYAAAGAYAAWKIFEWGSDLDLAVSGVGKLAGGMKYLSAQLSAVAATQGVSTLTAGIGILKASAPNLTMIASGFGQVAKNLFAVPGATARLAPGAQAGLAKISTGFKNIAGASVGAGAAAGGALAGIVIGAAAATYAMDKLQESGERDASQFLKGLTYDPTSMQSSLDHMTTLHARVIEIQDEIDQGSTNRFDDEKLAAESLAVQAELEKINAANKRMTGGMLALRDETGLTTKQIEGLAKSAGVDLGNAFDDLGQPSKELQGQLDKIGEYASLAGKDLKDVEFTPAQIERLEADGKAIEAAMSAVAGSMAGFGDILQLKDESLDPKQLKAAEDVVAKARERVAEAEKEARAGGQTADEAERTAAAFQDAKVALVEAEVARKELVATDSPLNQDKLATFYADTITKTQEFSANIREAIALGYDPAFVGRLLQAGPEQAGPHLEALVSNTTEAFVAMVNAGERELSDLSLQAVEMARLTQIAVNDTSKNGQQMVKDLGLATRISLIQMTNEGVVGIDKLAVLAVSTVAEVERVAEAFGLSVAGIQENIDRLMGDAFALMGMSTGQVLGSGGQPQRQKTLGEYLGGYANGGNFDPGLFLAGERGPELVYAGSPGHVTTASSTERLLKGLGEDRKAVYPPPSGRRPRGSTSLTINSGASSADVIRDFMWEAGR